MKKRLLAFFMAMIAIVLMFSSCQKNNEEDSTIVPIEQREGVSVNGNSYDKNRGGFVKVDNRLFFLNYNGRKVLNYMDLNSGEIYCNCNDPACNHMTMNCPAYISDSILEVMTKGNDGVLVATASDILKFTPGQKEVLASAKGYYGNTTSAVPYLFEDKMAVFTKDYQLQIQSIENEKVELTVDKIAKPVLGNPRDVFYYDGYLYLVRAKENSLSYDPADDPTGSIMVQTSGECELVRISLETGEIETLIDSDVANVSIYGDKIYYKNGILATSNLLMRANLDGSKQELVKSDVDLYNIKDDKIYYSSYDTGDLMEWNVHADEKDEPVRLLQLADIGYTYSGIYLFEDWDKIVLLSSDNTAFYTVNLDGSDLQEYAIPDYSDT